ncbi:MAG: hypothetical protein QG597_3463 [Actinomycetota bacterium]|nr:hypothetical protein [Actinomycetota bacterium]
MSEAGHTTRSLVGVSGYREIVRSIGRTLSAKSVLTPEAVLAVVSDELAGPEVHDVLSAAGTDSLALTARAVRLARDFVPRPAATATSAAHDIGILLMQQIDLAWWSDAPDFDDARSVDASADLIDMRALRREGHVRFEFTLASDRLLPRARNYAVRHWFPDLAPGTPGPSWPYARPEMVNLLNTIADDFARRVGPEVPPLWVNCLTRSVADQCRLQDLGFSAHLPSAHCRGWAADLEVDWFARFNADDVLVELLLEYQADDLINAIDEGQIWHVCPNPAALAEWTT